MLVNFGFKGTVAWFDFLGSNAVLLCFCPTQEQVNALEASPLRSPFVTKALPLV